MGKKDAKSLSLLDEDEGDNGGFTVNKAFADRYNDWRRKEETQKMKDKYGDDFEEDGEESESEESDDGADWTAEDEKDFLKTLSALKGEDDRIYDKDTRFWHEKQEGESSSGMKEEKSKKEKPMFLKDYERELVKRGGDIDEEEDDDVDGKAAAADPTYHEKQELNRKALKAAMAFGDDADDDDGEDLFTTKEKTEEQKKAEEDEYYEWIGGGEKSKEMSEKEKKELKGLKKAWASTSIDDDEKFLRDYILNKKYDTDRQGAHIPSYEEIVGTTLEDDEEEEEKGRDYERKYNFRFEEPDQEFIKQYPRTITSSVREGVNEKRKKEREDYKERKTREKEEKVAEIKQLKRAKKSEIEKKLAKLKKMAGDEVGVKIEDLEGDFDPKEYDRRMQELFSSSYYDVPAGNDDDAEKPVFSDLSDDDFDGDSGDDYDTMAVREGEGEEEEEEEETTPSTKKQKKPLKAFEAAKEEMRKDKESSRRRRRRNEAFVTAVRREKPVFDPAEKTFEQYFDEYYALDYEDIIGDMRTKFKYRTVASNSFGLSTEEILGADDRQLNAWASLKKAVAYRTDKEEAYDVTAYARKGADAEKKKRILAIDFGGKKSKKLKEQSEATAKEEEGEERPAGEGETTAENGETKKKRKNRKKNKGKKEEKIEEGAEGEKMEDAVDEEKREEEEKKGEEADGGEKSDKKKRNRKRRRDHVNVGVTDNRLSAYGINPKKFKGKVLYGKKKEAKQE